MSLRTLIVAGIGAVKIKVIKPSITYPTEGDQSVSVGVTLQSSAFATEGGTDTHISSDWEIATDPNFENIVASSYNDTTNLTSWKPNIPEA